MRSSDDDTEARPFDADVPNCLVKAVSETLGTAFLPKLKAFAHRLASEQADYFVFIARKAVCLLDVFKVFGWPVPSGRFVSNRAVEFMTEAELKNAKVVVVDDIVVVGTTVKRISDFLKAKGAHVKVLAFSVNTRWLVPQLYEPAGDEHAFDDQQASLFCNSLVEAIILCGRPYAVDFPLLWYQLPRTDSDTIWQGTSWDLVDASTAFHARQQQRHLALHIAGKFTEQMLAQVGLSFLSEFVAVAKVRVYENGLSHQAVMMPIVTFDYLPSSTLKDATEHLAGLALPSAPSKLETRLLSHPVLANRVLTFCTSYALACSVLNNLRLSGNCPRSLAEGTLDQRLRDADLQMSLGAPTAECLEELLRRVESQVMASPPPPGHPTEHSLGLLSSQSPSAHGGAQTLDAPIPGERGALTDVGAEIVSEMAALPVPEASEKTLFSEMAKYFFRMHHAVELKARRTLQQDPCNTSHLDRLNRGLTCHDLCLLLKRDGWPVERKDIQRCISGHLDYLVDRGVAVPVTYADQAGVTYRAYRPGEDVQFINKHFGMLIAALDCAQRLARDTAVELLDRIEIEKLMVVLVKYMYARQISTVAGDMSFSPSARVDFHRMGAVVRVVSPDPERQTPWMYDYLEGLGLMDKCEPKPEQVKVVFPDAIPATSTDQASLNRLARNWTRVLRHPRRDESRHVLGIVLSSCANSTDVCQSLYADIDFCLADLKDAIRSVCGAAVSAHTGEYRKDIGLVSRWRRVFGGDVKLAADNFTLKLRAHSEGLFSQFTAHGADLLRESDEEHAEDWTAAWDAISMTAHPFRSGPDETVRSLRRTGIPLARTVILMNATLRFAADSTESPLDEYPRDLISEESIDSTCREMSLHATCTSYRDLADSVKVLLGRPAGNERVQAAMQTIMVARRVLSELQDMWAAESGPLRRIIDRMRRETYATPLEGFEPVHLVWYDVKDSRSKKATDVAAHDNRVKDFKTSVTAHLRECLCRYGDDICFYHGDRLSKNDEKHIFVCRSCSVSEIVRGLLLLADGCPDIYLRVVALGCRDIDTDLKVFKLDSDGNARADGDFFNWFAEIVASIKAEEKERNIDVSPHTVAYQNPPWDRSGGPGALPRASSWLRKVAARVGDNKRDWSFRVYKVETPHALTFTEH